MVEARTLELKKATMDAENANKYKSEFLANMSHEIRTPMTGILGFVKRMKKSERDPTKLKEFEIISASGNTLLNIINDILDFSKIESGKLDLEIHTIEVYEVITQTSSIFKEHLDKKQISLIQNVDNSIPKYISGDEVRLKQVIFNLLSNAIKFTSENGTVTLDVKYDNSKLYIAVSDTGVGISSSLVKKMGGEIKVQSELGQGSKFYFEIPVKIPETVETKQEEEFCKIDENIELNGKILVVEDNKTNQMLLY